MEMVQQTKLVSEEKLIEEMISAGVHYGKAKRYTHPLMKPFLLFKSNNLNKNNIEFFNLKLTLEKLNEMTSFLKKVFSEGKIVLFVGTTPACQNKIKMIAETFNQPYLNNKWVPGFLTNFQTIQARLLYFKNLLKKEESGELEAYPLKERNKIENELKKLKAIYSGVINLERLPDFVFIINLAFPKHKTAKKEALKMKIPILSISGSDNDIFNVFKFIPANDKAPRSISWLIDYLINQIRTDTNEKVSSLETNKTYSDNK